MHLPVCKWSSQCASELTYPRISTSCPLQNFSADLFEQTAEPLVFVDFLREPKVDDNTGEVIESRPSCYEAVPGGTDETRWAACEVGHLTTVRWVLLKIR